MSEGAYRPGGFLALDLARTVGWAYGHLDAGPPKHGTWLLPDLGGLPARIVAFENKLADAIEVFQPSKIGIEASMPVAAMNGEDAARQQICLDGCARAEAWRASLPLISQDVYTVRLEILGTGRFPKGGGKPAVIAWCRKHGFMVSDHNAGDAVVLWTFFQRQRAGASRRVKAVA